MVEESTGNPALVAFVAELMHGAGIEGRDELRLARLIQRFSQEYIQYWREYPERWQSALRTIQMRLGDCDDKTILICSVLRSFRIPCRAKFLFWNEPKEGGKRVAHVYPQAKIGGKWVTLESVRPVAMGFDPEHYMREKKGIEPEVSYVGDK